MFSTFSISYETFSHYDRRKSQQEVTYHRHLEIRRGGVKYKGEMSQRKMEWYRRDKEGVASALRRVERPDLATTMASGTL